LLIKSASHQTENQRDDSSAGDPAQLSPTGC